MFFLNQERNPATASNSVSKSKLRLNIKDIKPNKDIIPRIKEQTQIEYKRILRLSNDIKPKIKEQTQIEYQKHQRQKQKQNI